jgi:hypothetical protein
MWGDPNPYQAAIFKNSHRFNVQLILPSLKPRFYLPNRTFHSNPLWQVKEDQVLAVKDHGGHILATANSATTPAVPMM